MVWLNKVCFIGRSFEWEEALILTKPISESVMTIFAKFFFEIRIICPDTSSPGSQDL